MSQFDHESDDQSEACNQLIRDFDLDKLPRPTAADAAAMLQQMAKRQRFEERRDAYLGPAPKRHLQDELYRSIAGAVAQYQEYLERKGPPPLSGLEFQMSQRYFMNPEEHFGRSLHAMVLQELDLYLDATER